MVTTDNADLFLEQPAISTDGTLTYRTRDNAFGTATITVTLHDDGGTANGGQDTSEPGQFAITVDSVNDAPIANNDNYETSQGDTLKVIGKGLQTNDFDVDNARVMTFLDQAPTHGRVWIRVDGTFSHSPESGFLGNDFFTYHLNDGLLDSNIANVMISVKSRIRHFDRKFLLTERFGQMQTAGIAGKLVDDQLFSEIGVAQRRETLRIEAPIALSRLRSFNRFVSNFNETVDTYFKGYNAVTISEDDDELLTFDIGK